MLFYSLFYQLDIAYSFSLDGHLLRREDDRVLIREDVHVLMREDGHVLVKALKFEVEDQRKKGRPKRTWKAESRKVGLSREAALCQSRSTVATGLRCVQPPLSGIMPDLNHWSLLAAIFLS